jgi:hypothetical protein
VKLGLCTRLKLIFKISTTRHLDSIIELKNGVILDLNQGKIKISGDFHIHATGDFHLTSDKHIIMQSGYGQIDTRIGAPYSVWINSELDHNGIPIVDIPDLPETIEANQHLENIDVRHNVTSCISKSNI